MVQKLVTALGRLYHFLISLIVAVILTVTTWGAWSFYQDAILQDEFMKDGQLVPLLVNQSEQKQRSWRDILSHSTYLTVHYRGKDYTTRFVMDSGYVGQGDRVKLLYHPKYDALRQPGTGIHFKESTRKSRLIEWTALRDFTNENQLLFFCILLSTATFFLISGLIATIVPVAFLQNIARFVFVLALLIGAIFFTYDTWAYYTYYQYLKTNGHEVTVKVLDTQRTHRPSSGRHHTVDWYDYEATIRYQQQERVIPISHDDFDALKPTDSLKALYDETVDDCMSVDFGLDYSQAILPVFLWVLTVLLIRPALGNKTGGPKK